VCGIKKKKQRYFEIVKLLQIRKSAVYSRNTKKNWKALIKIEREKRKYEQYQKLKNYGKSQNKQIIQKMIKSFSSSLSSP